MKQARSKIWASLRVMTAEKRKVWYLETLGCLIEGAEKKAKRENWADFSISANCFTCQVIQSTLKIEYFKCYLGSFWGKGN